MNITMQGKYQTRDGRLVRILCVDGPHPTYPIIGVIGAETEVNLWTADGLFVGAGHHEPSLDLVYIPVKHEGWIQWGSRYEPSILEEGEPIVSLLDFLKELPRDVHEIHATWETNP